LSQKEYVSNAAPYLNLKIRLIYIAAKNAIENITGQMWRNQFVSLYTSAHIAEEKYN